MDDQPAPRWLAPLSSRGAFAALALALVAAGLVPVLVWGGNLDVAWYLYVARRMLAGAHLYRDVIEVNPPLIVMFSVPAALLARALGVTDIVVFNLGAAGIAAGAAAFAGRMVARLLGPSRERERRAIVLLLLVALFPLAVADFGQREHLLLALVLPYLCVSAVRATGRAVPAREALAAGMAAGLGLALKPFYVPLWLAVEVYLAAGRRARAPWRRPEAVAIGGVLVVYSVVVVVLFPDYLPLAVRLGPVYASLLRQPLAAMVWSAEGVLPLLAIAAIAAARPAGEWGALGRMLLLAAAASLLAVLLQGKGWSYHYYPTRAEALVAFGVLVLALAPSAVRRATPALAVVPLLLLMADLGVVVTRRAREAAAQGRFERDVVRDQMVPLVRRYATGGSILGLTVSPMPFFPLVNYAGVDWALRFPSLWMIPALAARERWSLATAAARASHRSAAEQYLIGAVTDDLLARRPALIVLYAPPWGAPDLAGYLASADPRFGAALRDYRPLGTISDYDFYVRRTRKAP
jgi:hypothetical protein